MKKGIMVFGGGILLLVLVLCISLSKKEKDIDESKENELVATIEYGHNEAIDSTMYCEYDIYSNGKKGYTYELECVRYTIVGEQPPEKMESGSIHSKKDFNKIKENLDNFNKTYNRTYSSYYYIENYEKRKYDSLDLLINKLF